MSVVFVLNKDKSPLDPTTSANARKLLDNKKAVIHKHYPFVIRLKHQVEPNTQDYRLKISIGSQKTGLAILSGNKVIWLGELHHKKTIKYDLISRSQTRRRRRTANLRYRKPRFLNRKRSIVEGWLPPSILSRVDNVDHFVKKYRQFIPITSISYQLVSYDRELIKENPDIEYVQGTIEGYEIREYLLEKFDRKCVYTGEKDIPLTIDHVVPKSKGGSNRLDNLVIATHDINKTKDDLTLDEWTEQLKKRTNKKNQQILRNIPKIKSIAKRPAKPNKNSAIVNATRKQVYERLLASGLPVEVSTGGRTKMNRTRLNLPRTKYFDALAIGESTPESLEFKTSDVSIIKAIGRGKRQQARVNKFGFPIGHKRRNKVLNGLMTGDFVKIEVPKGLGKGTHYKRIESVRSDNAVAFKINVDGKDKTVAKNYKYVTKLQSNDGYNYMKKPIEWTE